MRCRFDGEHVAHGEDEVLVANAVGRRTRRPADPTTPALPRGGGRRRDAVHDAAVDDAVASTTCAPCAPTTR
jgi:hypothetical protein